MTAIVITSRLVFMTTVVCACFVGIIPTAMAAPNSPAYRLIPPMLRGRPIYNSQSQEKMASFEPILRDDSYYAMPSNWFFPGSRTNRAAVPALTVNPDYVETAENNEESLAWPTVDLKRMIMPALAQNARPAKVPAAAGVQPSGLNQRNQYSFFKMMG